MLKTGMIFKNYNELCEFMNWSNIGGKAKQLKLKELSRVCLYHKHGHKIIIDEVYDEQLPKVDNRKNNGLKYSIKEPLSLLLLDFLSDYRVGDSVNYTKAYWLAKLNVISYKFVTIFKEDIKEMSKELGIFQGDFRDFIPSTNNTLTSYLKTAFNNLKKLGLIEYEKTMIIYSDYSWSEASRFQYMEIKSVLDNVAEELELTKVHQRYFGKMADEYRSIVGKRLQEMGIYGYRITYKVTKVNNFLIEKIDKDELAKHCNDVIIENRIRSITKKVKRLCEEETEFGQADFYKHWYGNRLILGQQSISNHKILCDKYIRVN